MFDEMYLQKAAQYQAGEYVGARRVIFIKGSWHLYWFEKSVPFVVQAIREVTLNGQWLCEKIAESCPYWFLCARNCF